MCIEFNPTFSFPGRTDFSMEGGHRKNAEMKRRLSRVPEIDVESDDPSDEFPITTRDSEEDDILVSKTLVNEISKGNKHGVPEDGKINSSFVGDTETMLSGRIIKPSGKIDISKAVPLFGEVLKAKVTTGKGPESCVLTSCAPRTERQGSVAQIASTMAKATFKLADQVTLVLLLEINIELRVGYVFTSMWNIGM